SWLEIKGTNLASTTRAWGSTDFNGPNAPTSLDGVSVTINGKNAFVYYVSPTQINAQAPADSSAATATIAVTTTSRSSPAFSCPKALLAPGMLAQAKFNVSGRESLVGVLSDGAYVGNPGLISGAAFRPAQPGDSVTAYGIGFGDVTPAIAPGV